MYLCGDLPLRVSSAPSLDARPETELVLANAMQAEA